MPPGTILAERANSRYRRFSASRPDIVSLSIGMLHAGVTHRVLLCNDFKTLFIDPPSDGRRCSHAAPTGHQVAPDAVSSHDGIVSACD